MNRVGTTLIGGAVHHGSGAPWTYWLLWLLSLVLSATLIVLLKTRWGQSRPMQKCALLSLLAHLVLAFLAMTVSIVTGDGGGVEGEPIRVRIVHDVVETPVPPHVASAEKSPEPARDVETPAEKPKLEVEAVAANDRDRPAEAKEDAPSEKAVVVESVDVPETKSREPTNEQVAADEPKESPEQEPLESPPAPEVVPTPDAVTKDTDESPPQRPTAFTGPTTPIAPAEADEVIVSVSTPYSLRDSTGRAGLIAGLGGNSQTEDAVAAALRWLASAQSRDGRWDATEHGAGHEQMVLGHNRGGAGRNADTGVSALAILTFLGAGHTHLQGEYRDTVRRGLDFLLRSQAPDGSLWGNSTQYARMYCHSMATFALAEAFAMTGDRRLEAAVASAIGFSLRAQDGTSGGWRYRPGDSPGDTSQLGWQMMALASAKRGGIDVPATAWRRVDNFLRSVRRGNAGGLASYMPVSPATTSMTAEALYCRLLLGDMDGVAIDEASALEATHRLLAEPPSSNRANFYYWYYATLALHHRHQANRSASVAWDAWNEALKEVLVATQVSEGEHSGSWDARTVWGGYGGRVYTTAMAAMCLEVYYRYAPSPRQGPGWMAIRPEPARGN